MASRKVDMQRKLIEQKRDQLLAEIEAIKNQIAGLEMALSLLDGPEGEEPDAAANSRGGVRKTLLDLLREAGTTGLNATSAVEVAKRRGIHMDKGSVSSTLSRMKKEGVVDYQGDRYRLSQFANVGDTAQVAEVVH